MASNAFPHNRDAGLSPMGGAGLLEPLSHAWEKAKPFLAPLASLRLTVALFASSIFLIFIGTLAQDTKDIHAVLHESFRAWWTWVPVQVFFPHKFFPSHPIVPGGFPFPGGKLIGVCLFANLFAAHLLRFKAQARGTRLALGLVTIAFGAALAWAVIMHGSGKEDPDQQAIVSWPQLWTMMKVGVAALWAVLGYALLRTPTARRLERQGLSAASIAMAALVGWLWYSGDSAMLADASLRISWQLIEGALAGLVLLSGCWLAFNRRAGIVLLHAGVGLMMANELVVSTLHRETTMQLAEGDTRDYVEDVRAVELAVVDSSPADHDKVAAVSGEALQRQHGEIASAELPFDINVLSYLRNSAARKVRPGDDNPATAGAGLHVVVDELRPTAGADAESKVDVPAIYAKLRDKANGHSLGTYLFSPGWPQPVEAGGKTYQVELRFKRVYEKYSIHLDDVSMTPYEGTTIPHDYRSKVRLTDAATGQTRPLTIWMNHPVRYRGETIYQSGYATQDDKEITTLTVVRNTGWMTPYVACMLVVVGLAAHFLILLLRFLNRQDAALLTAESRRPAGVSVEDWALPATVVLVMAGWVGYMAYWPAAPAEALDLDRFGRLPLKSEGRVKPFETLARNTLRILSGKETFKAQAAEPDQAAAQSDKKLAKTDKGIAAAKTVGAAPAIRWLLDVASHDDAASTDRVFRIDHPEALALLRLEERSDPRYAIEDLRGGIPALTKALAEIQKLPSDQLSNYQQQLVDLGKKLQLYMSVSSAFDEPIIKAEELQQEVNRVREMKESLPPLVVPPRAAGESWQPLFSSLLHNDFIRVGAFRADRAFPARDFLTSIFADFHGHEINPAGEYLASILSAYAHHDAAAFNDRVAKYEGWLASERPQDYSRGKLSFESFFDHFAPFFDAAVLYLLAFGFAVVSWLGRTRPLQRTAVGLILLALAVHTFGLVARIVISGRPPVTNLYSSAVFVGWAAVVMGLAFEYVYRLGIGTVVASIAGFAALLVAHMLMLTEGDTVTVLRAVLDTNFWLATHVVCISCGYAATFVAGMFGLIYVLRGFFTRSLQAVVAKELSRMIYGTLCFAIFFSFFGTVLGGLWADDSWGRFWGWDPKENGALIIVIWNALVLHARWGGLVKQRGLAALAIGGNIVTSWSWFGVNQLGIGLHSYGFTQGVLNSLGLFVLSQLVIIGLACLPPRRWRSFDAVA